MANRGTIVVVEDEWIVARDIQLTLQAAGYHVPAVAASGQEALALIERERPDLILMDIVLRGSLSGIETVQRLALPVAPAVVYLTAHADDETLERARRTSPWGYIVKPFDQRQLLSTVLMALGRREIEEAQRDLGSERYRDALRRVATILEEVEGEAPRAPRFPALGGLSQREQEVVRALLESGRVPGIARSLYISPHTVRNHLKSAFRKLGVSSQAELIERFRGLR